MNEPLGARALQILQEWVKSESLRKHCYAVADSMKHFAKLRGEDADLWEAVGLLHDMDYERYPNVEQSPTEGHPFVGVASLRENGWSEEVCRAILSHADYANVSRETQQRRAYSFSAIISNTSDVIISAFGFFSAFARAART